MHYLMIPVPDALYFLLKNTILSNKVNKFALDAIEKQLKEHIVAMSGESK